MRFILPVLALLGIAAASQARQSPDGVTVTPLSDFRDQTSYAGAESPNGRFFVTEDLAGNFVRFNRATGRWDTDNTIQPWQARWSPNGRFLSYTRAVPGTPDRYVWVVPMDTITGMPRGTPRRISTRTGWRSAWSPDGSRIAFVSVDSAHTRVVSVPFNGGDEQVLYENQGPVGVAGNGALFWTPDGKHIIGPSVAHLIRINVNTRRIDSLPLPRMQMIGYSPDGARIAQFDYQNQRILISSAADGRQLQLLNLPQRVFPSGWSATVPNAFTALHNPIPGDVERVSIPDGALTTVIPVSDEIGAVHLSPDGRQVAFVKRGLTSSHLFVSGVDGSTARSIGSGVSIRVVQWSPDGKQVAFLTTGVAKAVHVADVAKGSSRTLVTATPGTEIGMALGWRSDGQAVRYVWRPRLDGAAVREAREVTMTGASRVLAPLPIRPAETRPQFINDTLALLRNNRGVTAVNLRTGATRSLYSGTTRELDDFGVSPDGQWIVFAVWNGGNSEPLILSLTTGEQRRIPYTLRAELGEIRFHPDGRQLVATACTQCNNDERWDVVLLPINGDPTRVLTSSKRDYRSFADISVAPDGRSVIFSGEKSWNMRLVTVNLPKP
jgi:Tol biopolymer transport system component